MAFKMKVMTNQGPLQIMNVTKKVGSEPDCVNKSNDVEAVQRLFNIALPGSPLFQRFKFGLCDTNGIFDERLGFYIFRMQRGELMAGFTASIIDGAVSTAKDFGYGSKTVYTIVALNQAANRKNKPEFDKFMDTFPVVPQGVE